MTPTDLTVWLALDTERAVRKLRIIAWALTDLASALEAEDCLSMS